jgi:hypothetical protein
MPERWRSEVRELGRLRPPTDLWERVLEGPRRPFPEPPTRRRLVAARLALALVAAAAFGAWHVFRSGPGKVAVGPSPSGSGYFIQLPDSVEPVAGDGSTTVVATTNLPDGTLAEWDWIPKFGAVGSGEACCSSWTERSERIRPPIPNPYLPESCHVPPESLQADEGDLYAMARELTLELGRQRMCEVWAWFASRLFRGEHPWGSVRDGWRTWLEGLAASLRENPSEVGMISFSVKRLGPDRFEVLLSRPQELGHDTRAEFVRLPFPGPGATGGFTSLVLCPEECPSS